jgi:hypothetical protein
MTAEQQVQFAIRVEALHYRNYIAFLERQRSLVDEILFPKASDVVKMRPSMALFAKYYEAKKIAQDACRECNIKRHQSQHFIN